jgi:hypothetical protein
MGWGLRVVAVLVMIMSLPLGAWPISLLALIYFVYSFRRPKMQRAYLIRQEAFPKAPHPWGRYFLGCVLLLLAAIAFGSGGTYSPFAFLFAGLVVFSWPFIKKNGIAGQVIPVKESILMRSRLFPFQWHALAEVKLESQGQARGISAMEGQLLVFAGKNPSTFQVVSVLAFGHRQAEERVVKRLRRETRMLSQRGAHILPLDSFEAVSRLSLELERLKVGTDDFEVVSSLPFDVIALRVKDGLVESHRAYNVVETGRATPSIPSPDLSQERQPLLAEVVQEIEEKHGWPAPDEFTPFLAALDASRMEPLADRIRTKGEDNGRMAIETPGGAEVKLTRAQLRAVARIYA